MPMDPAELSTEELEVYLRELFDATEELNATAIRIRVINDIVYLSGDVPTFEQRELAELLVLNVVPEDRLVNDLIIIPEVDTESMEHPEPVEIREENTEVERDDADEAAQEGKPYEPPISPTPEPRHEGEW